MKSQLLLYGTSGCHLCELAEIFIAPLMDKYNLSLVHIDIAEQNHMESYETRIPVLACGPHELDWPFDAVSVESFILTTKN